MLYNINKYESIANMFKENAIKNGYLEEELEKIDLSYVRKHTKSKKYLNMINHAYFLGMLIGLEYLNNFNEENELPEFKFDIKNIPQLNELKNDRYERIYKIIKKDGLEAGFSNEDLSVNLSVILKKTKSEKILRLIKLSYYLGIIRTIAYIDETYTRLRPF